jgi:hypothetical protein
LDVFISLEAYTSKVLLQYGGILGRPMVPNQDSREVGEESPSAEIQEVHCGKRNVWPGFIVQQRYYL